MFSTMCGRSAQRIIAVRAAAESLGIDHNVLDTSTTDRADDSREAASFYGIPRDNFNMSPGMDAMVFQVNRTREINIEPKIWGLVTKQGTTSKPLDMGMGQHFANLMYNARSDTLYSKPTFARLAHSKRTCLIALDGFFEWKTIGGRKEPFFVYRRPRDEAAKNRPYLLIAGLWNSVPTGLPEGKGRPTLDTYTILTTEVCNSLKWLHHRMPVCIWDEKLAMQWLRNPSPKLQAELARQASGTEDNMLQWHAVTPEMSKTKFRSDKAIKALPKLKTVKSFFGAKTKDDKQQLKSPAKRHIEDKDTGGTSSPSTKKSRTVAKTTKQSPPQKKGRIDLFFKPK